MDAIIESIDAMTKTAKILDYLSNQAKDTGLAFILDSCVKDLVDAGINLNVAIENEMPAPAK